MPAQNASSRSTPAIEAGGVSLSGWGLLPPAYDEMGRIIHKRVCNELDQRYQAVTELIAEVR